MEWLKSIFNGRHRRTLYMAVVGLLGILLLVATWWPSGEKTQTASVLPMTTTDSKSSGSSDLSQLHAYELSLGQELEQMLTQITGVGGIKVMLKLESGTQLDLAQNVVENQKTTQEGDPQGGTRVITEQNKTAQIVFTREATAQGEKPMVIRQLSPKVAGVVVVAEGADVPKTKAAIVSAVQTVLDIGAHRVQVYAKK